MARLGRGWPHRPRITAGAAPATPITTITTSAIDAITSDFGVNQPDQRATFSHAGRDWLIYADDTSRIVHTSSTDDGTTWAAPTLVRDTSAYTLGGAIRHADFHFDGTYLHEVQGGHLIDLTYRRGTPGSGGSIAWDPEQVVISNPAGFGDFLLEPSITTDSSGRPWIAVETWLDGFTRPRVLSSSTSDGTWTTDDDFEPSEFLTLCWPSIRSLGSGAMLATYWFDSDGGGSNEGIFARVYNGATWGPEVQLGAGSPAWQVNYRTVSVVSDPATGQAFVAYGTASGIHVARYSSGSWTVEQATTTACAALSLGFDDAHSDAYLVYTPTTQDEINLTVRSGSWSPPSQVVDLGSDTLIPATLKLSERFRLGKFLLGYQVDEAAPARIELASIEPVDPTVSVVASAGGSATLLRTSARTRAVSGSGGGSASLARARVSRASVAMSGGGGATFTATRTYGSTIAASGGGNRTLAARKNATRPATGTAGGTGTVSGAKTPDPGGVLWTGMFGGGGGRAGRGTPARIVRPTSTVPMNVANPEARSGSVVGTGGGNGATARATGPTQVFAPVKAGRIGRSKTGRVEFAGVT